MEAENPQRTADEDEQTQDQFSGEAGENFGGQTRPQMPESNNENKDQKSMHAVTHEEHHDNSPGQEEAEFIDNTENQGAIFSEEEVQNLREIFDLFDKEKNGTINVNDLHTIMGSLQRDPNEVEDLIQQLGEGDMKIDFDAFVRLMQHVEAKIANQGPNQNQQQEQDPQYAQQMQMQQHIQPVQRELTQGRGGIVNIVADSKVLDFLRLLEEYRRKCEDEDNYGEARKARAKFDELLKKETARQRNNIRAAQEQELLNIEAAQKAQFLEFSQAWDNYMSDYEATAYLSLEKLKEKHMLEFQQFQEKIRNELRAKMNNKFSRDLYALRDKEKKLVKMKRYEEAEKIKMKADLLEEFERNKMGAEMNTITQKKEAKIRHQQQLALAALLKRIQRDRNEQLKHRQQDSQRLIQRNKNILNDLLNKQNAETKRTLEHLKQTLGMTKLDNFHEVDPTKNPKNQAKLPASSQSKKRPVVR